MSYIGAKPPHPINIKGHERFIASNYNRSIYLYFLPFYPFTLHYPNPSRFSSFVTAVIEDVSDDMPMLGQPWQVPPERSFEGPDEIGQTSAPNQVDWL
jgi:hypothetical protein